MNLKRSLTVLFLILLSFASVAQDYKTNIRQCFTEYTNFLLNREFEKSLAYVPEVMFTVVPRTKIVAMLEQLLNNKEMELKMISFNIKEIGTNRKIDSCYYVNLKYISLMSMRLISDTTESSEYKANRLSMIMASLANSFGSGNVKLDKTTQTFTISPTKNSWAISKNGLEGWQFVNVDPKQRLVMEKVLPKELIDESMN